MGLYGTAVYIFFLACVKSERKIPVDVMTCFDFSHGKYVKIKKCELLLLVARENFNVNNK